MRLILSLLLLLSGWVYGVELQRGKSYLGPIKLTAKSLGVGLGISPGWLASLPESGGLQIRREGHDLMITMRSKEMDTEEALQYLNLPVEYEPGVMLFPSQRIVNLSSTKFRRSYRVNGRNAEAIVYVVLGPQRRAVVVTGLYAPQERDMMQVEMFSLVNTVTFTALKPLKTEESPLKSRLKGGFFTFYENVGLRSEQRELWFCSNNRFILRMHQAVTGGKSTMITEYRGHWVLDDTILKLQFSDGSQQPYLLQDKGHAILFNGNRSYRLKNRLCR